MSWVFIFLLAGIVFFNRYVFLEPKVAIQFPVFFERMLKYSAPCLLTAICIPIIFYDAGEWRSLASNSYFYATIFCVLVSIILRRVLLSLALSLLFFYTLEMLVF
ncbi:branched-chain amino acid transporter [Acinetobacter tandoii]|uniref:AzlD domain-containing protein n=1 Tax=Acinetobacter tandoii TaxID=202954 RepID=UPI000C2059E7|nr:AzlD domain-containing protein [Acinetobacter tandoii]PJG44370.1 branched-chain amino acid transporter [Acinetobacter tandoii]